MAKPIISGIFATNKIRECEMKDDKSKYKLIAIIMMLAGILFDGSLIFSCIIVMLFMMPLINVNQIEEMSISEMTQEDIETMVFKALAYMSMYVTSVAVVNNMIETAMTTF